MEEVKIREFLAVNTGDGWGAGSGAGSGDGSGDGWGAGSGAGWGAGRGAGSGAGWGDGLGAGIAELNGQEIYEVDGLQTIFKAIKGNVAKGAILQNDLTLDPCYIVKGNGHFAHGKTLHEAMEALRDKMFEDLPEEERIAAFIKEHPEMDKPYDNKDLFEWHHHLTGSCLMGRETFVKDRGLSLDGETTVRAFIELTKNAYGGDVIKRLEETYG